MPSYNTLLLHHKAKIFQIALGATVLTIALTFLFPLKYAATTRVLVISKSSPAIDPYTAAKASERIGENLTQVISSATFLEQTLSAGFAIDATPFNAVERVRRRRWKNAVSAQVIPGTGLLSITAYHTDRKQAEEIAKAVSVVLASQGWQYVSGEVQFRVLDTPVATRVPVRPNLAFNALVGFLFGALLGGSYVLVRRPAHG